MVGSNDRKTENLARSLRKTYCVRKGKKDIENLIRGTLRVFNREQCRVVSKENGILSKAFLIEAKSGRGEWSYAPTGTKSSDDDGGGEREKSSRDTSSIRT